MDTTECEVFWSLRDQYLRCANVVVHVMSKDHTTEEAVESYVSQAIRTRDENIPIVFAVNKIDLSDDDVPMEYICKAVKTSGATNYSIVKTSAKTGEGVTELFDRVVRKARIGRVSTIEYIKKILEMDKDILEHKKKKCLVM